MDSTHLRNLLLTLHLAALAGALGLGAWAIADTIHLAGSENLPLSLERGGISVGFLSLASVCRHSAPARFQSHRLAVARGELTCGRAGRFQCPMGDEELPPRAKILVNSWSC